MPTIEELEAYIAEVENYIASLLPALETLPTLPQRIYDELQRFGPPALPAFPTLGIPALPPPPPPPPPPPRGWSDWFGECVGNGRTMRRLTVGVVLGAGLGLAGLYGWKRWRLHVLKRRRGDKSSLPLVTEGHRREAVVVLGADHSLGQPICSSLEKLGFIVIATTSSPSAGLELQRASSGYVRALPLDPASPLAGASTEEDDVGSFPRKLQVALSQRFPTSAAGDPYMPVSHLPHVTVVISLLSLPTPGPTPLAYLPMSQTYLPHLVSAHVTPVMLIQSLLPIMRRSPLDRVPTVIALLPAMSSIPGNPFGAVDSATTIATASLITSLRRELAATHDPTRLISMYVGALALPEKEPTPAALPTEAKETYGSAWAAALASVRKRRPSDISRVTGVIDKILLHRDSPLFTAMYRVQGGNINIGAGAAIYAAASRLPRPVLDILLAIPYYVATLRAQLTYMPPPAQPQQKPAQAAVPQPEQKEKPLAIEPVPVPPAMPAAARVDVPAPVIAAAEAEATPPEEHHSDPESDLSIEEHSGSESEWEKVRQERDGMSSSMAEM